MNGRLSPLLPIVRAAFLFGVAGLFEIGGGHLVWQWLRERRGVALGVAGMVLLAAYGVVPTLQPREDTFGRTYAAYRAAFIVLSLLWGWAVDGRRPDGRDVAGALVCLVGVAIILWPRAVRPD